MNKNTSKLKKSSIEEWRRSRNSNVYEQKTRRRWMRWNKN